MSDQGERMARHRARSRHVSRSTPLIKSCLHSSQSLSSHASLLSPLSYLAVGPSCPVLSPLPTSFFSVFSFWHLSCPFSPSRLSALSSLLSSLSLSFPVQPVSPQSILPSPLERLLILTDVVGSSELEWSRFRWGPPPTRFPYPRE